MRSHRFQWVKHQCQMPLNAKGEKVKKAMESQYGKEKGERVFYASESKGTIKGVTKGRPQLAHQREAIKKKIA